MNLEQFQAMTSEQLLDASAAFIRGGDLENALYCTALVTKRYLARAELAERRVENLTATNKGLTRQVNSLTSEVNQLREDARTPWFAPRVRP